MKAEDTKRRPFVGEFLREERNSHGHIAGIPLKIDFTLQSTLHTNRLLAAVFQQLEPTDHPVAHPERSEVQHPARARRKCGANTGRKPCELWPGNSSTRTLSSKDRPNS